MLTNLLKEKKKERKYSVHTPTIVFDFASKIQPLLEEAASLKKEVVFVCIGTDRSTGDSLGPLTGTKLKTLRVSSHIYGTLDKPVHATNLIEHIALIQKTYANPYIIAIDACLGQMDNVGYLSFGRGSVRPGAAVKKDLPPIGDAYITGIVNVSGFMEHLVLQSTRLNLVMKMADAIAGAIAFAIRRQNQLSMN